MKDEIEKLIELLEDCNKEDLSIIDLEILEFNIDTVFETISKFENLTLDNKYQLENLYNNAKNSISKQIDSLSSFNR